MFDNVIGASSIGCFPARRSFVISKNATVWVCDSATLSVLPDTNLFWIVSLARGSAQWAICFASVSPLSIPNVKVDNYEFVKR